MFNSISPSPLSLKLCKYCGCPFYVYRSVDFDKKKFCCLRHKENAHYLDLTKNRKKEIFQLLGNKCVKCGYIGPALQIDHVNGGGTKERQRCNGTGVYYGFILKAIKNGSKDYQVLCANCNMEKGLCKE